MTRPNISPAAGLFNSQLRGVVRGQLILIFRFSQIIGAWYKTTGGNSVTGSQLPIAEVENVHLFRYRRSEIHASRIREKVPRLAGLKLEGRRRVILEDLPGQVHSRLEATAKNPDRLGHRAAYLQVEQEIRIALALLPNGEPDALVAERVRTARASRRISAQQDSLLS